MNKYALGVIVFLLFVVLVFILGNKEARQLERNFITSKAVFDGLGNSRNAGTRVFVKYKFASHGKTYYGNTGISCNRSSRKEIRQYLENKEITIIFNPRNPSNSKAILRQVDFEKYHLRATKQDSAIVNTLNMLCGM